ncbi:MAG: tRNA (adenosine(37)-N6)-threonylcarbamoyltransferase complex dimerization subunit type 1 TsaB [Muribaculaceae bacterium]|nr:tRNA (adenosine(37)-N6)-threonylcarbamoyltransferase complex dimerization subunit type 1 TsaB [Muribaculaceae bacterium]
MATILNIETSGKICSVALTKDGVVEYQLEDTEGMKHAERLGPFIEKAINEVHRKDWQLDAISVSIGPGSYTGLRIGLSMAKGLCMALDIPLIGVSTLQLLVSKAMFMSAPWNGEELFFPMIDARRMEVYGGVYDFGLNEIISPGSIILDENLLKNTLGEKKIYFLGDGSEKAKNIITSENAYWLDDMYPHARDMLALSEVAYRKGNFLDIAYSTPAYLKEWQPGPVSQHSIKTE